MVVEKVGGTQASSPQQADSFDVHNRIKQSLTRSITDPVISDNDVANVTNALSSLSAGDFKKEIERMDREGLLKTYIGEMTPKARAEFLQQAKQKGYVAAEAGEKASTKQFDPPSSPALYKNDPKLPAAMREVVHEENVQKAKQYGEAYDGYLKRYSSAVKNAKSADEIMKLGKPAEPATFREPGMFVDHPDYHRLSSDWNKQTPNLSTLGAYKAISDKCYSLTGLQRPGSAWVKAEVTVKHEKGPGVSASVQVGDKVEADIKAKLELKKKAPDGLEGLKRKGLGEALKTAARAAKAEGEVGPKGAEGGVGFETASGTGVKISNKGEMEAQVGLGAVGVYAKGSPSAGEATFEGGVAVKKKLGKKAEVEAKLGAGMKTITAKEAENVFKSRGFFATPPELEKRIPWEKLTEDQQLLYAQTAGWTKERWNSKLK